MTSWQELTTILLTIIAVIGTAKGFIESKYKKNPFGITYVFRIYGAFVWADMVIIGLFWTITGMLTLLLKDWNLFLLIGSIFWLVRSIGESIYWFNQQFSSINRNPVQNFTFLKHIFHNDSVWFVYQTFWQCMTVVFAITSLYVAKLWLSAMN